VIYGATFEKERQKKVTTSTLSVKLPFTLGYDVPDSELVRHTYTDWGLLQVGKAYVSPPEVQELFVDVPGLDGSLDLTQALDGLVHYKSRQFVSTYKCIASREEWPKIYTEIMNWLHGQKVKVTLDDDRESYYEGRFTVESPTFNKHFWTFQISGTVDAYKYKHNSSLGDWDWDPFVFDADIARDYSKIEVSGTNTVIVIGYAMPTTPTFVCSDTMTLTVDGINKYELPKGESIIPGLTVQEREYIFKFDGYGTVSVDFKGGEL